MALAWVLRNPVVTSALVGASSVAQLEQNVAALNKLEFSPGELEEIDRYATEGGINLWAASSAGRRRRPLSLQPRRRCGASRAAPCQRPVGKAPGRDG